MRSALRRNHDPDERRPGADSIADRQTPGEQPGTMFILKSKARHNKVYFNIELELYQCIKFPLSLTFYLLHLILIIYLQPIKQDHKVSYKVVA